MRIKSRPSFKDIIVLNHKREKPEWELLAESGNVQLDKLISIYNENPFYARVIYKQKEINYETERMVAFRFTNGDINIIKFIRKHGISTTNKMYSSERNVCSIIYKKETNKWYYKVGKLLNLLDYGKLSIFCSSVGFNHGKDKVVDTKAYNFLVNEISWLRNVNEYDDTISYNLPFNTIIKYKLYNRKAINRHTFKVPTPVNEMLLGNIGNFADSRSFLLIWGEIMKVLKNVENLKVDFFNNEYFMDTCKMAGTLGKVVNCSWSFKRLKLEHDKFAREISQIVLLHEELSDLTNSNIFLEFANHMGYQICLTNHELINRGIMMNHCVGTYISRVNSGYCGIYITGDFTFELYKGYGDKQILTLNQLQGYNNKQLVPKEIRESLNKSLDEFNENILPFIEIGENVFSEGFNDGLPF